MSQQQQICNANQSHSGTGRGRKYCEGPNIPHLSGCTCGGHKNQSPCRSREEKWEKQAAVYMRKIVTSVSSDIREGHEHLLIGKLKTGGVTSRQASYQRSCPPRIPVKAEATIFHRNKFGRGKFGRKIFGYVTFL